MEYVEFFEELKKEDVDIAGGKGANLGELTQAGIPVPPGFVITSATYQKFMDETGITQKIMDILDALDVNNNKELQESAREIKKIIIETEIPDEISSLIIESYNALCHRIGKENAFVAVRSSATAEDLPEASFAGQQDTYLNVKGPEDMIKYVRKCWASLFGARAIFYREENNFDHSKVYIAVVVQEMVDAEKAGVMFTVHPSTGEEKILIEGAWGLGEAVVSGTVTPDTYWVDKATGEILRKQISEKNIMFQKKSENGQTVKVPVPEDLKNKQVLNEDEIAQLVELGKRIQEHYQFPQDTEWAIENGKIFMLQSRPVTTLDMGTASGEALHEGDRTVITKGLGASPGMAAGSVKIIKTTDELDKVQEGDILVTVMTTPDMVPAMKRANGIITDEGGVTCHAAIVSRELGIPCVVGTGDATSILPENSKVTLDGNKGIVWEGLLVETAKKEETTTAQPNVVLQAPLTVTEVKVNVSMSEAAKKAAATGADGVGLLRTEHMMLTTGVHPKKYIQEGNEAELVKVLVENILKVADTFYPKTVWYRTLDAPTDEFQSLDGGEDEPYEHNPMLGWRGIRRELDEPEILLAEFKAIKKLHEQGYTNIGIMLPLVQHPDELKEAKKIARQAGLKPQKNIEFGIMVETPAAALTIEDFIAEGIDFVSFGTNDLTQYTLAIDRNNENVADLYTESHPAVLKLIERVIIECNKAGVKTSICGQAGSMPAIVEKLVELGITSVSANTDAVATVRETVARVEQKLLLKAARKMMQE
ncbi:MULTISPECIES: phosphoenolpyruvate synthase [Methanobacterium]|jgi:pyruvate,water dikinase|uniref:Phosphoenolpyruvate synthase n=1 Tax=Methanobacterium formicicum TaxID=2162 RepID=A0A089ZV30_METFO|nr:MULTISPECIES: phosphoenolpyruvate synthase [Methanobacterium]AIS31719.1 phosphoenolpyruvate synthase PpsA1 [Methanobacterium formicicum]KUK73782.1 MAG: Phosphoenolpyruvate synthase [Methanobacterium sp. 42_16]MDD4810216.1 phosphoenolpyruvate synthase [Methanobacterium formicicum]MDG3548165.1 phosphoenolpyruvate synthase [Methanobacterium formicicum]CEL25583.1 putative phosphoenolpyruvate synthase [Methanobacterium formicicum]